MSCMLICSPPMHLCLQVMRDPDTGISKGFGFISFDSFEASGAPDAASVVFAACSLWLGFGFISFASHGALDAAALQCSLLAAPLLCTAVLHPAAAARCFEAEFAAACGSWQLVCVAAAGAMGRLSCAHAWLVNCAVPALFPLQMLPWRR